MILSKKLETFLTSFCILFLELALIRYLPSQIAYLGYYSNFILLATFIGMGSGILLAKKPYNLARYFPWALFVTIATSSLFTVSVISTTSGDIHFKSNLTGLVLPELLVIPIVFILVAITTACLSQKLGTLLDSLPPLTAYTWDILGSLAGIAAFTICSYLALNPLVWFGVLALVFLFMRWENSPAWRWSAAVLGLVLIILIPTIQEARWSPYQKVTYQAIHSERPPYELEGYRISVNNIDHQYVARDLRALDPIYPLPYTIFNNPQYNNTLIIGAGSGTDVAMAIKYQVKQIDAVEIDPELLRLGYEINPNHPYQDNRVTTYVDDARSYLQKTNKLYDLIIFALPDSLVLASGRGNIRLESFLFTTEAFTSAKKHLAPNGLLVLYNYYRKPWLVAKLAGMLKNVFNEDPYVVSLNKGDLLASLMIGPKIADLSPQAPLNIKIESFPKPASDNWPFVYLLKPSLPWLYILMLGIIAIIIYWSLSILKGESLRRNTEPTYFFLGAAFMLLETESIIRFALLFGSTWIVNSLVFFAILSLVLVAIRISALLKTSRITPWYIGLGLSLAIQYFYPLQTLLGLSATLKYAAVTGLTLLPIFFANIIFSLTFKNSTSNSNNFASNIMGAALGGILEYLALATGYRNIILIIMLCYLLAFTAPFIRSRLKKLA